MTLAERIKFRRGELGITQQELGDRCGWRQSKIGNYETGHRVPSLGALKKLESALEAPVGYLTVGGNNEDVRNFLHKDQKYLTNKSIVIGEPVSKIRTGKPVLRMKESNNWRETMQMAMLDTTRERILIYPDHPAGLSEDYVPIAVDNDAMLPDFKKGDIIIIDPYMTATTANYVVANIHDTNENILAQYFVNHEEKKAIFKFTNSDYPIVVDLDKFNIVGVVTESRKSWI